MFFIEELFTERKVKEFAAEIVVWSSILEELLVINDTDFLESEFCFIVVNELRMVYCENEKSLAGHLLSDIVHERKCRGL